MNAGFYIVKIVPWIMKDYNSCLAFPVFRSLTISILSFDVGFSIT